ncbi:MAG: hypothetical protein KF851_09790 [Pirellulaceae bacterium]|nr:hypothetical protein [Pirellulaceae bacterium]
MKLLKSLCLVVLCCCLSTINSLSAQTVVCFDDGEEKTCAESLPPNVKFCFDGICKFRKINGIVVGSCDEPSGISIDTDPEIKVRVEKKIVNGASGYEKLKTDKVNCGKYVRCWCDAFGVDVPVGDELFRNGCDNDVTNATDFEVEEFFPDTDSRQCRRPDPGPGPDPVPVPVSVN